MCRVQISGMQFRKGINVSEKKSKEISGFFALLLCIKYIFIKKTVFGLDNIGRKCYT